MAEKTTVVITSADGHVKTLSGDTAIVFTVENARDFMENKAERINANVGFVGKDIPEFVFADIIGELVASMIKKHYDGHPTLAAFDLDNVSQFLKNKGEEIIKATSKEELDADIKYESKRLLKMLLDLDFE